MPLSCLVSQVIKAAKWKETAIDFSTWGLEGVVANKIKFGVRQEKFVANIDHCMPKKFDIVHCLTCYVFVSLCNNM